LVCFAWDIRDGNDGETLPVVALVVAVGLEVLTFLDLDIVFVSSFHDAGGTGS
jgi:hypothetical protein